MKDCNPINTSSEFGMKLNKDNGGKKVDNSLQTNSGEFNVFDGNKTRYNAYYKCD